MIIGMVPMVQADASQSEVAHDSHDGEFSPLSAAVVTLEAGDYYLTQNLTVNSTITISGEVRLCLNGNQITGNANPYFSVGADAALIICDCAGTGMIGDVPTEENGTITYPHALNSGYINVTDGILKLYGGTITGNKAGVWGGAVQLNGAAEFYMYGGTITKNGTAIYGGAISAVGTSYFEMNGGTISYNTNHNTTYNGGAICLDVTAGITINGGIIEHNKATNGGAIGCRGLNAYNVIVNGGTIRNNSATKAGGAFYFSGDLTMSGGEISGNTAASGGAVYGQGLDVVMTGGQIKENTTTNEASADVVLDSSRTNTLDISGTAVIDEGAVSGKVSESLVHELEYGGCVYSTFTLNYDQENDTSVAYSYDADSALHSYISTKAKTWCDDHDKTHKDYTALTSNATTLSEGSYYLTGDLALTGTITVSGNVHLCLNGKELSGTVANKPLITISGTGTLTICDCVGTGSINGEAVNNCTSGLICVDGGVLKLYGGTITKFAGKTFAAVYVKNSGDFYMYGGAISGNSSTYHGGAVCFNGGEIFEMRGGTISGNSSTGTGGGVSLLGANIRADIYGGTISNNSTANGGGIYANNAGAIIVIHGGDISGNTVSAAGGAFYIDSSKLTINGGTITGNTANLGGAIRGNKIAFTVTGGSIENNTTKNTTDYDVSITYGASGTHSVVDISGDPVIDAGLIGGSLGSGGSAEIHDLSEGACVYSKLPLSTKAGDTSVLVDAASVEGVYIYSAKKPSNNGIYLEHAQVEGIEYSEAENLLKAPENTTLTTALTLKVADGISLDLSAATVTWSSSNEEVATVSDSGVVTYVGWGTATITATVENTEYYASINVKVGDDALKVLIIGNSFSRDSLYYLSALGIETGNRITAGYLYQDSATLRDHASIMMTKGAMSYYKSDASTGEMKFVTSCTISTALEDEDWDCIVLQQGVLSVGVDSTYNSDLEYLIDCVEASNPDAKLYWNMTWSLKDNLNFTNKGISYAQYNNSQQLLYNAIVDCLDKWIVGNDAPYSSTNADNRGTGLGWGFDGFFFTGAAIQQLREATDIEPTRDGYHLNHVNGRVTAALAIMKVLDPDLDLDSLKANAELIAAVNKLKVDVNYDNYPAEDDLEAASLAQIIEAIKAAAEDVKKNGVPSKVTVPEEDCRAKASTEYANVTVGQADAPMNLYFPDVAIIDGEVVVVAYEGISHNVVSSNADNNKQLGAGRIVLWKGQENYTSAQWQASYQQRAFVIDDYQMQQWGALPEGSVMYDRYAAMQEGKTCYVLADFRDPNLVSAKIDMTGDEAKEDVLLLTFWANYYQNVGNNSFQDYRATYLTYSLDKGETWSAAQLISPQPGLGGEMKRGDLTVFKNGNILVPFYITGGPTCREFQFNKETGKWTAVSEEYAIPNTAPDENNVKDSWEGGEMALVSPDGGDTVYAFVRKSGVVLKSVDRGANWVQVTNEPGTIAQPCFLVLDDDLVYAAWHQHGTPIKEVGRLFYLDADWTDTEFVDIYLTASTNSNSSDRGDPGIAKMSDERVFVVAYDTNYNSIVGMIEDPLDDDFDKYKPIELDRDEGEGTQVLGSAEGAGYLDMMATGSHTVTAEVSFTSNTGKITVDTAAGAVDVAYSSGLELNKPTTVAVSVIGNYIYTKVTQGSYDSGWVSTQGAGNGTKTGISAEGATVSGFEVTHQIKVELQETMVAVIGNEPAQLSYTVMPVTNNITFASNNANVATVDNSGLVTFVGEGQATITMTIGNLSYSSTVVVKPLPAEITGRGETVTILDDDFENYAVNGSLLEKDTNKVADGWYTTRADKPAEQVETNYSIIKDGDNHYLQLKGSSWFMNAQEIAGDYTIQFDLKFNEAGYPIYSTMWQRDTAGVDISYFIWLQSNGYKYQYTDTEGTQVNYPAGASDRLDYGNSFADNNTTDWLTVKMVRTDGTVYMKAWKQGTVEPADWNLEFSHDILDTSGTAHFRIQTGGGNFYIDNLMISQQVEEAESESPVEATRTHLGNSLSQQFAVSDELIPDGSDAYAVIDKQNADGTVETQKVWLDSWGKEGDKHVITFSGVDAKEMTDTFTVKLYNAAGQVIGSAYTDSTKDYAMRQIRSTSEEIESGKETEKNGKIRTMMVDMLNYGAAAQNYFDHNTDNLANKELTEAQQTDWATQELAEITNTLSRIKGSNLYVGSRLNLRSSLGFQMAFNLKALDLSEVEVRYSYTDHYGKLQEGTITNGQMIDDRYVITVDALVLADARQDVTVTVYWKNIELVVVTDSIAAYVDRVLDGKVTDAKQEELKALCEMLMKFADSSYTYLHHNDNGGNN